MAAPKPGARSSSPSAEAVGRQATKGRSGAPFSFGCFAAYSSPFCRSLSGVLTVFRPALSLYSRRIRQKGACLVKCPAKPVWRLRSEAARCAGMACSSASPRGSRRMFAHGIALTISLDVGTLFVVATCVTALLGVFLLFAWTQDRIRALAWWGAAYLIGGFSVALWGADAQAIPVMPASLPTALLFVSCGMIWNAARLFHGRHILWLAIAAR